MRLLLIALLAATDGRTGKLTPVTNPATLDYIYVDQGVTQWRASPAKKSITITAFGEDAGWRCE